MSEKSVAGYRRLFKTRQQPRKPLLGLVIVHGYGEGFALADEHHQLLSARDTGVNEVALQE